MHSFKQFITEGRRGKPLPRQGKFAWSDANKLIKQFLGGTGYSPTYSDDNTRVVQYYGLRKLPPVVMDWIQRHVNPTAKYRYGNKIEMLKSQDFIIPKLTPTIVLARLKAEHRLATPEEETILLTAYPKAFKYARMAYKGKRWPGLEQLIMTYPIRRRPNDWKPTRGDLAGEYTLIVGQRWPELEPLIAKSPYAEEYAAEVLKGPFQNKHAIKAIMQHHFGPQEEET